jgi:hypothetical protein
VPRNRTLRYEEIIAEQTERLARARAGLAGAMYAILGDPIDACYQHEIVSKSFDAGATASDNQQR